MVSLKSEVKEAPRTTGRAVNLLRRDLHERREAFSEGLEAAGFEVVDSIKAPTGEDLVLTWNVLGRNAGMVDLFRARGAKHVVAENGYLGARYNEKGKPFAADGEQLHALALQHHNGAGRWYQGHVHRWRHQGITVSEWREESEYVLVLGQRGIGEPGIAMPRGWVDRAVRQLRGLTDREVRVRPHPARS